MTNSEEKKLEEIFQNANQEYKDLCAKINDCWSRDNEAKRKIIELDAEKEEVKQLRSTQLAEKADITKSSNRLKEIEEEKEIQLDLIAGLEVKAKELKTHTANLGANANEAFRNLIKCKLRKIEEKYNREAPKLVSIINEHMTMDYILQSNSNFFFSDFKNTQIIPKLGDKDNPFFKFSLYDIHRKNEEFVRKKYNIPEYRYN